MGQVVSDLCEQCAKATIAPPSDELILSDVPEFENLHDAFVYCKPNKSDLINNKELFAKVAAKLANDRGSKEVVWSHLDQDGNGAVSFPEFVEWAEANGVKLPTGVGGGDAGVAFPPTWTGPRDDKKWNRRIPVSDPEVFAELQGLLDKTYKNTYTRDRDKTGSRAVPKSFKLVSVKKNENYHDWRGYYLKRHLIERQVKSDPTFIKYRPLTAEAKDLCGKRHRLRGYVNEWLLLHGTNEKAAESICGGDFTMRLAGSATGTMYGSGIYLAESCTKADEYAQADKDGVCMMLVCRVIGGRVIYNEDKNPDPDSLQQLVLKEGYNCVLGDREKVKGTFKEYVVFDADQIFVEYVISYKRVY